MEDDDLVVVMIAEALFISEFCNSSIIRRQEIYMEGHCTPPPYHALTNSVPQAFSQVQHLSAEGSTKYGNNFFRSFNAKELCGILTHLL